MPTETIRLSAGPVPLDIERSGAGSPMLLLHGGAGPASMRPLAGALDGFEAVIPTHPGFDDTERPAWLATIADLADVYLALLDVLELKDVVVVGNSAGGWIAAEMAVRRPALAGIVLLDAVGLQPTAATGPIVDPRSMPPQELVKLSFAQPVKAPPMGPGLAERMKANQVALMTYAGEPFMHDLTLVDRLARIQVPSLVLWGERDGIVTPDYGREYARRIPGGRFDLIPDAGHLPQIEQPEATGRVIRNFAQGLALAAKRA